MTLNNNQQAFFELLRAGLWEKDAKLSVFGDIDLTEIYRIAEEQSVVGLVAAGLEHVTDIKLPKEVVLKFIGQALQLEQRNTAMNAFIAGLIERLREQNVQSVLLKGQGVAQCYERPLWRESGDIDLLLDSDNYERAKILLVPIASAVDKEYTFLKHLGMSIDGWYVELHGTFLSRLSRKIDCVIENIHNRIFRYDEVRTWQNDNVIVNLPSADNDVLFLFTHILRHFFFEGIGIRQICDWCRLMWIYRDLLDYRLLESRVRKMGLLTEWKAFAAYAVELLGMPVHAMPLYSPDERWKNKSSRINSFVLDVGNFGHKQRRNYSGMSYVVRKFVSFWGRLGDILRHLRVFPKDSIAFFGGVIKSGFHAFLRRE